MLQKSQNNYDEEREQLKNRQDHANRHVERQKLFALQTKTKTS